MQGRVLTGPRMTGVLILIALALAAWFMVRKPALQVDAAEVTRGPMTVTVDDLGETRVRDLFVVASPVTGELLRVPFKPGAAVKAGDVVAEVQPIQPAPVDRRTYAQTVATISAREAEVSAAQARIQEARAAEQLAEATFRRLSALVGKGFVTLAQTDAARAELERSRAARAEAQQAENAAQASLKAAQAALRSGAPPSGQAVRVAAPVSGSVLRVLHESRGPVVAGTQLLEIGDPTAIEMVSDMLSADAVRISPGAAVEIDAWGGETPLKGRVRLVEPFGFTKISALGVEEQRVNVVIDLVDPLAARARLGHGYRGTVRVALWSAPQVLQVPIGALFRQGQGWAAFVIGADGKAHQVAVKVGHVGSETAEVLGGLERGDRVILHPGEKVQGGVRVTGAQ